MHAEIQKWIEDVDTIPEGKSKFMLVLAVKMYGGVKVYALFHFLLKSAPDTTEWSNTCPVALTPGKGPLYPFYRRLGGTSGRV
jgi:hypothetical protein